MNILLLCDDRFHPGDVPTLGVMPLKTMGFSFDVIADAGDFDPAILSNYAAVIMSKSDHISHQNLDPWKTPAIQDAFVQYVENGGGLIVTHSGTVAGTATDKLHNLIGCRFAGHPAPVPVTVKPLKPHPVIQDVEMFIETDEHYALEILADDIDILAASYAPAQGEEAKYATEPYFNAPARLGIAAYVRTQGRGRVCVLTPGHNIEVWHNPQFQSMLKNALLWGARK